MSALRTSSKGVRRPGWLEPLPGLPFFHLAAQFGLLLALGLLLGASGGPAEATVPTVRQILLVDADADAFSFGNRTGCVWILSNSRITGFATAGSNLSDPVAVVSAPNRNLFVADASADPLGLGGSFGALFEADPARNPSLPIRLAGASALFRRPVDLLMEEETGTVLLLDRETDPGDWGNRNGCVFRIDPVTNSVSILAAPSVFVEPVCLARDLDGSVLIIDQTANPLENEFSAGALFRLNPRTGSVSLVRAFTRPMFVAPAAVAVIDHGPHAGDYLVVDKDADPSGLGVAPGGVFRVPRNGDSPVFFCDALGFQEPIDILVGQSEDVFVLDRLAQAIDHPNGVGAIYRFRLSDGVLAEPAIGNNSFRSLSGFLQVTGAQVDSTAVSWGDENGGQTSPGDVITVRARIRNTGTADAPNVSLADTLQAPFTYVSGSDYMESGEGAYDPRTRAYRWRGSLARGAETLVRYRFRIADDLADGERRTEQLTVRTGEAATRFDRPFIIRREFADGIKMFVDISRFGSEDMGVIYVIGADSTRPAILCYQDARLRRPVDSTHLDDGRLAILDLGHASGDTLAAILAYSRVTVDSLRVLRYLFRSDGFVQPLTLALDGEGKLLIIDRNANPLGHAYTPDPFEGDTGPGAIFRYAPNSGELEFVASEAEWREPVDAVVDRQQKIVVLDLKAGAEEQGSLFELLPGTPTRQIELHSTLFRDPAAIACDPRNDLFICESAVTGAGNPNGGSIVRVRRRATIEYSVMSRDSRLRKPADIDVLPNGRLLICDVEADPHEYPSLDNGAVFELDPLTQDLRVVAAHPTLRQPEGVTSLGVPEFGISQLAMLGSGDVHPGDTVEVRVRLINSGTRSLSSVFATLTLSGNLSLLGDLAPPEGAAFDLPNNRVGWVGRVAQGDTVGYSVFARAQSAVSYGDLAEATLLIIGGDDPVTIRRSRPIRADFLPNDLILVDSRAYPGQAGTGPGAVFRLQEEGEEPVSVLYTSPSLQEPTALEWSAAGELLIAASRGAEPGALYRLNTSTGGIAQLTAAGDTTLRSPVDLLRTAQNELLIVDPDAPGPTATSSGAVYRKLPGQTAILPFAADSLFRSPQQICRGPDGRLYLADRAADPEGTGGNTGAVFVLDEVTGERLDWIRGLQFGDPSGVALYDDSTLVITDPSLAPQAGALLYHRPASGRTGMLSPALPAYRAITRSLVLPSGEILTLDPGAAHAGQSGTPGIVHGYHPVTRQLREFAWSDSFRALADLAQKPGPVVRLARYTAEDLNGAPLHAADRLRIRAQLRNVGLTEAAGVAYHDTLPGLATLLEGTVSASSGTLALTEGTLDWTGAVAPGDSVDLVYDLQLNPALAEGRLVRLEALATAPSVGEVRRQLNLETHVPLEPGHLYIVDASANPHDLPQRRGAIFKVDMVTGSVVPMLSPPEFRSPFAIALVGEQAAPKFLIYDAAALNQLGQSGTLFLFDPADRSLRNIGGHTTFRTPSKVLDWTAREALLVDTSADPFDLQEGPGGPGALYKIDFVSGVITPVFSDTLLKGPTGLAWWNPGVLAITATRVDFNGEGQGKGALFTLDMATMELDTLSTSPFWDTPTALASRPAGGLYLIDRVATPYDAQGGVGSVFSVNHRGDASVLTVSKLFKGLTDVWCELDGNPLVLDENSDPYGFGGYPGGVFRWKSQVTGRFLPLSSSPLFAAPKGFVPFGGVVPIAVTEASAETAEDGVLVRWRGSEDEPGIRFLLYRRDAAGPDDPGDADASRYRLASPDDFLGPGPHEFLDRDITGGAWYVYLIARVGADGSVSYSDPLVARAPGVIARLELLPPAPNPLRPGSPLRYAVPPPGGRLQLALFDVAGRRVRVLTDGPVASGRYATVWDGRDDAGRRVPSGVYFARLEFGKDLRTARLVLLR